MNDEQYNAALRQINLSDISGYSPSLARHQLPHSYLTPTPVYRLDGY